MIREGLSVKKQIIFIVLTCVIVGLLWLRPFLLNFGSEIIDGRMEISLSQTTVSSISDIFDLIDQDGSLSSYFLLLFLSFIDLKGKIVVYYAIIAILGAWGAYRYFFILSKNSYVSILLSICYTCSLPLAVFYSSKYGIFSHLYAIVPLIGYLVYKVIGEKEHFYKNASLLFLLSLLINPYNLSVYIAILLFGLWCGIILILHTKIQVKIGIKIIIFFIILSLLPSFYMFSQARSFSNLRPVQMAAIQSETYQMTNTQSSYLNTILLKGIWDFNVVWPGNYKAYNFQNIYGNKYLNAFFFLSIFLLLLGLLKHISSSESSVLTMIGLTTVIIIPMIVGAREGIFSELYIRIYEGFTPFQIFRQGYKWTPILVLLFCTTFAYVFSLLRSNKDRNILLFAILAFTSYNIIPFVLGEQTKDSTMFHIPDDYYEVKKHIPKNSTLLLLPEQYHASYTWGSPGGPIELIFSPNIIHAKPQPKYSVENVHYFSIIDNILSEQMDPIRNNTEYDYILVRKDFSYNVETGLIHDPLLFKKILDTHKFDKVLETKNLVLYLAK